MSQSGEAVELGDAPLIERFENDIEYDAHSFRAKFGRSRARRELARRGRAVLRAVIDHLREHPPTDDEVKVAWGRLLREVEDQIDPKRSAPRMYMDTDGWISWAERFAA